MINQKAEAFFQKIKGKRVAFCGIGRSNLPLIRLFHQKGAVCIACDRRTEAQLGQIVEELRTMGVSLKTGETYLDHLDVDILFRTPGMKYHLPALNAARAQGIAVTSEMEVFFQLCPCKIYGVTGSDGKTTTTTILSEFLKEAGKTVHLGGNIGKPLLPEIESIGPDDVAVVELSSFQLISMRQSPDVAIVTNLSPNHLDIHRDMDEYIGAKKNILLHQTAFSRTVLNQDNALTMEFAPDVRGQLLTFSRRLPCKNGAYLRDGKIIFAENGHESVLMDQSQIRIPGMHNVENYLAAISAVWGVVPPEAIVAVAQRFGGVAHRAELVRTFHGVTYYNDSIGTSPTRTIKGTLSLYKQKIILIAGGYDKNLSYDELGEILPEKVKALILMGATADKIENATRASSQYQPGKPEIYRVSSMEEAVQKASEIAQEGDIVSMSPASASFDLYPNFEARGDHFKAVVNALQ
ncbi:MAG: UDP-N-acetylmuramoyl-L-alanine--D-glutamate ligase [Oscillospiraceae bacterium]|nr:UDP-N-acetylmuramoyl-L-alanine--D-glutamate ligase [Oscillospiraceae bacterium]